MVQSFSHPPLFTLFSIRFLGWDCHVVLSHFLAMTRSAILDRNFLDCFVYFLIGFAVRLNLFKTHKFPKRKDSSLRSEWRLISTKVIQNEHAFRLYNPIKFQGISNNTNSYSKLRLPRRCAPRNDKLNSTAHLPSRRRTPGHCPYCEEQNSSARSAFEGFATKQQGIAARDCGH